jgi:AraC-like DNA-binding protein/mannose-6-phosphate isomerase-like protein (cupin superfamily)
MSQSRQALTVEQEAFLVVRSMACDFSSHYTIEPHQHQWHQLLYACAGAMTVHAGRLSWMIPPGKAVFIPAGFTHSIRMWGEVAMRSLAFAAQCSLAAEECRVLSVTPLLRELILRIISMPALDSRVPTHQRLLGVLLDEMAVAAVEPLMLPLPLDSRAVAIAQHVLKAPCVNESLDLLSRRYGAGRRTVERSFRNETGMSFGLWRQKVRMLDSVRLLSEGKSVTDAALDTGYTSVSAFIAAFKNTFGCTPGRL